MKKITLIFLITLLSVQYGIAQVYYVTHVTGNIWSNHKPVKLRDKLTGLSHITSNDKNAELYLFNPQKGKLRLSFANSKPIPSNVDKAGESELYELTVGEFLLDYSYNKILTARGDFDMFTFFNNAGGDDGGINRVLLVEGQALPVKSRKLKTTPDDRFFLCLISGKDTLCNPITRTKDKLIFDQPLIYKITNLYNQTTDQTPGIMKIGFVEKNDYHEEFFPKPVYITFLTRHDLKLLVDVFKEGLNLRYHNSNDELLNDIDEHLNYCYGNFYQPAIHKLILADLK